MLVTFLPLAVLTQDVVIGKAPPAERIVVWINQGFDYPQASVNISFNESNNQSKRLLEIGDSVLCSFRSFSSSLVSQLRA